MDDTDDELMSRHGITSEAKVLYHYEGHRYERLADAVNYARIRETQPGGNRAPPEWDDQN